MKEQKYKKPLFNQVCKTENEQDPTKKHRQCGYCETSINHKIPSAKYCSKQCSNKIYNKRRTQKNRTRIYEEIETIEKLINQTKPFFILVSYFDNDIYYYNQNTDDNIIIPKDRIKKIKTVYVTANIYNLLEPWQPITNPRAKRLIKIISDRNTNAHPVDTFTNVTYTPKRVDIETINKTTER